jgi:hypothetical protein
MDPFKDIVEPSACMICCSVHIKDFQYKPVFIFNKYVRSKNSSASIIRMTKSRRMIWAGHVACMVAKRNAC